jgi:hypothetical protein
VFNIGKLTSENNPLKRPLQATGPAIDTWTRVSAPIGTRSSSGGRISTFFLIAAAVVGEALGGLPRRLWDRLFAVNDAEADWRGWETINSYGGLGRRYRDPRFDALGACPRCQGTGIDIDELCDSCLGTGRLTIAGNDTGEVSP